MTVTGQHIRSHDNNRIFNIVAVVLLAATAFVIRCHSWPLVFSGGRFLPDMPDVFYHLRLLELIQNGTFHTPLLDRYILFPSGSFVFWPAGFDRLMASAQILFRSVTGNDRLALHGVAFLVPAMGSVTLVVLYRIFLKHVKQWTIAAALLLLPVTSISLTGNSAIGRIDHQVMETLLFAGMLWCIQNSLSFRTRIHSISLGFLMGGGLWIWNGMMVYAALMHGFFFMAWIAEMQRPGLLENWRDTALSALGSAMLAVLAVGTFHLFPFSSVYLSFFHVTLYGIGACVPGIVLIMRGKGHIRTTVAVVAVLLVLLIGIGIIYGKPLLDILTQKDPVSRFAPESRGFFSVYTWPVLFHQPLLYLSPFALWGLVTGVRSDDKRALSSGMLTLTIALAILAAFQIRFLPAFELTTAVSLAIWIGPLTTSRKQLTSFALPALFLLTVPALNLFMTQAERAAQTKPTMIPMAHALTWLREHSPEPGNYLHPAKPLHPGYSVFCPDWTYGHCIVYWGHRPVIATPFGATPEFRSGIEACVAGIRCGTVTGFHSFCDNHGIRYVITLDSRNVRQMEREAASQQTVSYYHFLHESSPETSGSEPFFRLVYNSPYQQNGIPAIRIFEVQATDPDVRTAVPMNADMPGKEPSHE